MRLKAFDIVKNISKTFKPNKAKTLMSFFFIVILSAGVGNAAVSNLFSDTVNGNLTVEKGLKYRLNPETTNTKTNSFTTQTASGGVLTFNFSKMNQANDETQPSVELIQLDLKDKELNWKYFESISSNRQTNQSRKNFGLNIDSKGNPSLTEKHWKKENSSEKILFNKTVSDTSNKEFGIINTNLDEDLENEVLICIAGTNGKTYKEGESWNGTFEIDTKSSFPSGEIEVTAGIQGLYNLETGSIAGKVRKCPQYN